MSVLRGVVRKQFVTLYMYPSVGEKHQNWEILILMKLRVHVKRDAMRGRQFLSTENHTEREYLHDNEILERNMYMKHEKLLHRVDRIIY